MSRYESVREWLGRGSAVGAAAVTLFAGPQIVDRASDAVPDEVAGYLQSAGSWLVNPPVPKESASIFGSLSPAQEMLLEQDAYAGRLSGELPGDRADYLCSPAEAVMTGEIRADEFCPEEPVGTASRIVEWSADNSTSIKVGGALLAGVMLAAAAGFAMYDYRNRGQ